MQTPDGQTAKSPNQVKDNCGGKFVRVRGAAKVRCHLMFGIVVIAAEQILRLVT